MIFSKADKYYLRLFIVDKSHDLYRKFDFS